jgi:hypothetical protein
MISKSMKIFPIALLCVLMTGCATRTGLYQWGGYDAMLYQSYKNPEKAVEFRQGLELHITKMEASNQKVAPGLYAELGTLYLQTGDNTKAVSMYKKERDAWPESRGLMDSLITNVAKRSSDKT